jgi:anti-anti-sigma regulatory factor
MLRITEKKYSANKTVLFLEGKICQEWAKELQVEIEKGIKKGKKIVLDFSKVSYLDEEAAKRINQFPLQKVEKKNCSLFIRTMLGMENREDE